MCYNIAQKTLLSCALRDQPRNWSTGGVGVSEETASHVNSSAWRTLHAGHVRKTRAYSCAYLGAELIGRCETSSSCPCTSYVLFWTQTQQVRKLLNSHLSAQVFLGSRNLSVGQIKPQSLSAQWNKGMKLNTGRWIQRVHVTGSTGAAGDAGLHRKRDTFAVLSDRAQQHAAELSIFPTQRDQSYPGSNRV